MHHLWDVGHTIRVVYLGSAHIACLVTFHPFMRLLACMLTLHPFMCLLACMSTLHPFRCVLACMLTLPLPSCPRCSPDTSGPPI